MPGRCDVTGWRFRCRFQDVPEAEAEVCHSATGSSSAYGPAAWTTATTPRCAKLLRVDLLVVDDFALQNLDNLDTADIYELIVERHRSAATVVTSTANRSSGSP